MVTIRVRDYSGTAVTGKSIDHGGIVGRAESTGRGVAIVTRELCQAHRIKLSGARVVLQGFGQVGAQAALQLHQAGCKVIALADIYGAVYNAKGIDVPLAIRHVQQQHEPSLQGFPNAEAIPSASLLEIPCDVLIPAATERVITEENAANLQTQLLIEGANGPTTPEADKILAARGIPVAPDILCNCGGVTVSWFEWRQNREGCSWDEATVNTRLEQIIMRAFSEVQRVHDIEQVDYRMAAYMVAIQRLAAAAQARGRNA